MPNLTAATNAAQHITRASCSHFELYLPFRNSVQNHNSGYQADCPVAHNRSESSRYCHLETDQISA